MSYKCECGFTAEKQQSVAAHLKAKGGNGHRFVEWEDIKTDEKKKGSPAAKKPAKAVPPSPELASIFEIVQQGSYTLFNTPNILIPYACAKRQGFPGTLQEWFEIIGNDFWIGRGIDPYKEVGYGVYTGLVSRATPA